MPTDRPPRWRSFGQQSARVSTWRPIRVRQPRRATLERAEDRRFMVTVHDAAADQKLVIVKGDPSEVLALCRWRLHNGIVAPLEAEDRRTIEAENLAMAEDALRVLGIAYRSAGAEDRGTRIEQQDFIWAGLVGMADPIRKGAPDLIDAFRRAGITSIMLTGDQRATAAAVASRAGAFERKVGGDCRGRPAQGIRGADRRWRSPMGPDGDLPRVFARVAPGQKLQLVRKLQHSGLVVAMIGDGVNDTPPLRAADIGIALGRSGVEAARGIADVVLLEDDLTSLVDAVERGRTVAINIRKAIRYLVATNLSEIIFMLVAAAAGRAHPLSPIQLLWINLLTDVLPALGLAMEPAAPDLMTRPPRDPQEPVISAAEFGTLARDASLIAASAFAAQACAARFGGSDAIRSDRRVYQPRFGAALLCLRLPLDARIDPVRSSAPAQPGLFRRPRLRLRCARRGIVRPRLPQPVRTGARHRRFRDIAGRRGGPGAGDRSIAQGAIVPDLAGGIITRPRRGSRRHRRECRAANRHAGSLTGSPPRATSPDAAGSGAAGRARPLPIDAHGAAPDA